MKDKCCDFRTGEPIESQTFFDDKIDVHHIFPQKWCKENNIEKRYYDSIINKTAISARTNRKIGGNAPSKYHNISSSALRYPSAKASSTKSLNTIPKKSGELV